MNTSNFKNRFGLPLLLLLALLGACKKDKEPTPLTVTQLTPVSGPAGTTIQISGIQFSTVASENQVKFNGKTATVTAATATGLTVSVPQGAGTGPVTVQVGAATATGPTFNYVLVVNVSTLAGSGTMGNMDGPVSSAQFGDPNGVAVDKQGNVYMADWYNHNIRKITPAGVVTTLAGSGQGGFADGQGTAAKFNNPMGLAVDKDGNVYVGDYTNHRVRKITPAGVVSTVAGSGVAGFADGDAASAQFNAPTGVVVDENNNLLVTDFFNNRIRRITPAGQVSTLAGTGEQGAVDGAAGSAQFWGPISLTLDKNGNLLVADRDNARVRKISPAGQVSTVAGGQFGFADGAALTTKFDRPNGIAVDEQGVIYVADRWNHRVRRIGTDGAVSTLAGTGTGGYLDGEASKCQLNQPVTLALDAEGNLFVAESQSKRVRKINTR